jgi:DNA primase small subunit
MEEKTISFLKRTYREYYFKHNESVEFPTQIAQREFGYIPFGGSMIRHLVFESPGQLVAELLRQAPSSVYCSNATYSNPSLPMDEKGWKGAELIFDIDADSIPSSCKASHNWWYCQECSRGGKGVSPATCPSCHGNEATQVHWACGECLAGAKQHARRLIDFLVQDFGLSEAQIRVYFSGNRGYHIHVDDDRFEKSDTQARAEIANYIRGSGINLNLRLRGREGETHAAFGWGARIDGFLANISQQPRRRTSQKILDDIILENASLIDSSVTTDIHRVFRMPGTLHGDSGMLKIRVDGFESFDPLVEAVVLGDGRVKVHVGYSPEFVLRDHRFGPFNSSDTVLPTYAAVYLLARGLGRVAE